MNSKLKNRLIILSLFLCGSLLQAGPVLKNQIVAEVTQHFKNIYQVENNQLNISYLRFPDCSSFCDDNYDIDVYTQRRSPRLGYQTIWVELKQDSKLLIKFPVSLDVSITGKVVVALKKIDRHSMISAEMLALEERTVKSNWNDLHHSIDQVIGTEATRVITRGSMMSAEMIRIPPVVHRGDQIELQFLSGNLMIRTSGIARGEGAVGDMIHVKNESTGKKFKAQIKSPGVVVVR